MTDTAERFVAALACASIGDTFNQYSAGERAPLLRARVEAYLRGREEARILLVGEAAGYRGARVSGLPFTSERQLTGSGPAEATATIVQRVLVELDLHDDVLLWNVVPTHPGTEASNRPPSAAEVRGGTPFVERLSAGRRVIAVGRVASRALDAPYVRHPSHGGAAAFREGLVAATLSRRRSPDRRFLLMTTYTAKPGEIQRDWYVVDADGKTLGRLATQIADTLRGKGKPQYTAHVDTGDFVIVVNAAKIRVTGNKLDEKMVRWHSGYPGGLKERTLREQLERRPTEVIRRAVKGMLPKNRLAAAQLRKLKVYAGPEHPHTAQAPKALEL
jgi:large subunit ribosomal protein L13